MGRMIYRGGQGGMGTIPGGPLGKARYALSNGHADEAERIVRKRLERSPDDTSARVLLAQALLQQGQAAEAAVEARRAIREQSTNVDANLVLSAAMLQRASLRGVPAEAEQAARRAVQLAPKQAKTHVQLAEVLAAKRDLARARAEADEAVRLEPRLAAAHLMRALILLSDKDPEGAIQAADTALRYDRTMAQAEFIKANALLESRRYDESLAALDSAERSNPLLLTGANAHSLRGRIYYKQRQFKKAYTQFLQTQVMNSRLRPLAPVLAGVNMVLVGQFGQNAQFAWVFLLLAVLFVILFGISFIPVVGPWIVAALVLALIAVTSFGAVRQARGRILPAAVSQKITVVVAGVMAFAAVTAIAAVIISALGTNVFHAHELRTPLTFVLAGAAGLAGSALGVYLLQRYAPAGRAR
jgi:tetratricopeptide (TPR) repeat protein